jgi:hypothetical protein
MPFPIEVELAKERMLGALEALESYVKSGTLDNELHKQLSDALRVAIDDFIAKLSVAFPG